MYPRQLTRDVVPVLVLHFQAVLVHLLGGLGGHLVRGVARVLHLLDLLERLELDEQHDGVDLVLVQLLDGGHANVHDAVDALELFGSSSIDHAALLALSRIHNAQRYGMRQYNYIVPDATYRIVQKPRCIAESNRTNILFYSQ